MAGIGFELRKLTRRGDLLGQVRAYVHASMSTSGAWLFTIAALAAVVFFGPAYADYEDLIAFRLIVIYNFAFSLVLTGPVTMILTRYLADQIFTRTVEGVPGMVVGGLVVALGTALVVALPVYVWYFDLTAVTAVAASIGLALVTAIWVLGVFLSTLKAYGAVTRAFGVGMVVALIGSWIVGRGGDAGAMLTGFNVGLAWIVFALLARILAEFPFPLTRSFAFLPYFRRHWPLAASGLVYYLGLWVDKWLMWNSPEREVLPSGLVSYPDYDSASFLALLTIIPAMAVFVVQIETRFVEQYHRFFREIGAHATLDRIRDNQATLENVLRTGSRQIVLPQIVVTMGAVLLAPTIFTALDIPYGQLAIFRITAVGAAFQLFFVLLTIILTYLDFSRLVLKLHGLFFVTNALGTMTTIMLGFPYYGYGYFVASIVAFVAASIATLNCLEDLPYHTFVTSNTSIGGTDRRLRD